MHTHFHTHHPRILPAAQQDVAMLNATFCITPMGAGWGIRLPEAMLSGCIPIITQDHVYMVRHGMG